MKLLELKKQVKTLAIDCSTKSIAFAMYDDKQLEFFGEVEFPGKLTFDRLAVGQEIMNQLKDRFDPDQIILESAVYIQNKQTVILLAYAIGAYLSAIASGADVVSVHPMEWQSAIGNGTLTAKEKAEIKKEFPDKSATWIKAKGRELRKQRTIDIVNELYGLDIQSDNVGDAIAIGHAAVNELIKV